ncbi:hypothetical protein AOQ84DRAFT_347588 [Glonium stellatum]|uniref:Endonuclease/exonuclease/phosphatase domain-containing protein n=1 Tax=Glonium stellatum TaxID=574774 RepID=A0A8E2JNF7_9PEZI|nr:hypothetical protein AOQ84DRAFT_347588 [Glonium stellatum]
MASELPKPGSFQAILAAKLAGPPAQKLDDSRYQPKAQLYYLFDGSTWETAPAAYSTTSAPTATTGSSTIRLITWNIDILADGAEPRMAAALEHLENLASSVPSPQLVVIFLQEMGQSDLVQIQAAEWVRARFLLTDIDSRNWDSPYCGTTTLVDRRLNIEKVFRVPWITKFERDGLFVDTKGAEGRVVRLCNTHLESLVADPPIRPLQLAAAAKYIHAKNVQAALLAGDLNAIQPFDRTLHIENGLKDAYLELGGEEDSEDGYTWGHQVPQWMRDKFGCSRMDKILYSGSITVKVLERIGVGVKVVEGKRQEMRDLGCEEWVTDHYGLMGEFELDGL